MIMMEVFVQGMIELLHGSDRSPYIHSHSGQRILLYRAAKGECREARKTRRARCPSTSPKIVVRQNSDNRCWPTN